MHEGFDMLRFDSRLRGRARRSSWTCRFHGWRNILAGGAATALVGVCTQWGAGRGKPYELQWALSQGLLGRLTNLILIVVYSSMAASGAAGTPPPPAPPSHPPGDRPSSRPSLVPVHPCPQAPTQCLYPPPLSGTRPHPSPLGARSCPHIHFTTSRDPSLHSVTSFYWKSKIKFTLILHMVEVSLLDPPVSRLVDLFEAPMMLQQDLTLLLPSPRQASLPTAA